MSFKLHLISSVFMQIRCNFPDISYLSETQKNNFQFLSKFYIKKGLGFYLNTHDILQNY